MSTSQHTANQLATFATTFTSFWSTWHPYMAAQDETCEIRPQWLSDLCRGTGYSSDVSCREKLVVSTHILTSSSNSTSHWRASFAPHEHFDQNRMYVRAQSEVLYTLTPYPALRAIALTGSTFLMVCSLAPCNRTAERAWLLKQLEHLWNSFARTTPLKVSQWS